jgi:hypothetical protein
MAWLADPRGTPDGHDGSGRRAFWQLSSSDSGSSSLSANNATVAGGGGAASFDEVEVGACLEDLTIGEISDVDCKARHDVEVY